VTVEQPPAPAEPAPVGDDGTLLAPPAVLAVAPEDTAAPLKSSVTRGLTWSMVNSVVSRFGQVAVGILLARLLAPEDFGVFAVALVAYTIVINCSEMGVSVALVRRPADGPLLGPTVTTLTLLSSSVLFAGLWAAAPLVADRMNAPSATGVLRVLDVAILVAGLSAVPAALIQRDFQQRARFGADTVNLVVSTVVVVVGALDGWGAYALAWSRVAGNAAAAIVLFAAATEHYWPGFDRKLARELLGFGLPLAGASLLSFAVLNVDYIVVGATWGPAILGFYVLAFNLASWPVGAFSTTARAVLLPAFARLRDEPGGAAAAFVNAARWLLAASVLVSVLLGTLAGPAIHVVYGEKWAAAAVPLAYLAALGTFRVLHELSYDYLVAMGRTRAVLLVQGSWFVALVIALPVGAKLAKLPGVGSAHLLVALGVVVPAYGLALRRAGVDLTELLRQCTRPLLAGVVGGLIAFGVDRWLEAALPALLLGGTLGTLGYLVVVAPALPPGLRAYAPQALLIRGWRALRGAAA
jgi:O-antigen/teichoic acid export membrane protein